MSRVSIVIPNWNGMAHLPMCLEALAAQTFDDFETIVVDNASSDGSVAYLQEKWPQVRVVSLPSNKGFPGAVNAGVHASDSAYVVLLNNDTRAEERWLETLVGAMDAHPEFTFGSSKLLRFDEPQKIDSAGHSYSLWRSSGENIGEGRPAGLFSEESWIFGACAAAAIYRRSLFDDIGDFDEEFFFLHEDVEFDVRANVAGHRCLLVPDAIVYHKRGGSFDVSPEIELSGVRNRIWVATKTLPPGALLLWVLSSLLRGVWMIPVRLIGVVRSSKNAADTPEPGQRVAWSGVRAVEVVRSVVGALRTAPAKRRSIASVRRVGSVRLLRTMIATQAPRALREGER